MGTSAELAPDVAEKSLTADELLLQSLKIPQNGDVAAWIRCLKERVAGRQQTLA